MLVAALLLVAQRTAAGAESAAASVNANAATANVCGNEGGSHPPPCHVPTWPATWQMNASTIIMPCNYTGYQVPATTAGWGVVDCEWLLSLRAACLS